MEVLLLDKDYTYCKELMNAMSSMGRPTRITFIANSMKEVLDRFVVDVVLANIEFRGEELERKVDSSAIIYLADETNPELGTISKSNIDLIIETVEKKCNTINDEFLEKIISGELALIGYNFSLIGTKCLIEAIKIMYKTDNSYYTKNLENIIYPPIAEKFNLSTHTVKNNILYATAKMFDENDKKKLYRYFGFRFSNRPGTKTVIYAVLENIKMKLSF